MLSMRIEVLLTISLCVIRGNWWGGYSLLGCCHAFTPHRSKSRAQKYTIPSSSRLTSFTAQETKIRSSSSTCIQEIIRNGIIHRRGHCTTSSSSKLFSTPFDASLYDNDDDEYGINNPFKPSESNNDNNSNKSKGPPKIILGLNKYSHDTTLCAADATTGQVLFALSKERLSSSRTKHASGNVATLVDACLDHLQKLYSNDDDDDEGVFQQMGYGGGVGVEDITKVVVNNHHHRVLPMERRENKRHLEWEEGLNINGGMESGYTDEENLFISGDDDSIGDASGNVEKVELSHHMAHAYSAVAQCPFDSGLVVVMDGMGETYRTMKAAMMRGEDDYIHDLLFEGEFECIPSNIQELSATSIFDYREGESVYEFTKSDADGISVKPVFKRFIEEQTPPTLYNHGFENMDSVGALYSRASSHIFGDWNACGKVMGLAPWMGYVWKDEENDDGDEIITASQMTSSIMKGKIYEEGNEKFQYDRSSMMGTPLFVRNDPDLFNDEGVMVRNKRYDFDENEDFEGEEMEDNEESQQNDNNLDKEEISKLPTNVALDAITVASRVQQDLESVAMDFVKQYKEKTNQSNLCLAGGVALNSVLNGRLSRELGFKETFIPPYPGDDGIAVGCCAYGLFGNSALPTKKTDDTKDEQSKKEEKPSLKLWKEPLSPYLGPSYTSNQIRQEIERSSAWLDVELVSDDEKRLEMMAQEVSNGGVIAWYHGRSEIGPRALGHRSILANPSIKGLVRFINEIVKKRESFRPFAPSVLAEEVGNWFELGRDQINTNISPYMSITAMVKEGKRDKIPAVTHVDGSSRLQTVTKEAEPLYHRFLSIFYDMTGIPMVLNTSFNTLPGEPIVETPRDAIRSFLCSMGSIEMLVMGDYVIKRKDANLRMLLGEKASTNNKNLNIPGGMTVARSFPRRAGPVHYETKFTVGNGIGDEKEMNTKTRVCMPARPMHNEKDGGWFELLDDLEGEILGICNGSVGVNEILNEYVPRVLDEEDMEKKSEEEIQQLQEILFSNIVERLVRLYEHSFISW